MFLEQITKRLRIIITLTLLICFSTSCDPVFNKPFQTFEKKLNEDYSIRFSAYDVNCFGICDAEYILESFSGTKLIGKRLLTVSDADPMKINSDKLVIKNQDLAYFSLFTNFAVTKDGGKTWSIWDQRDHQKVVKEGIGWIKNVEISQNGDGTMRFEERFANLDGKFVLETKDFGKTWKKP